MVTTLSEDAELHRQVHPALFKMDGSVMSSAFVPKKSDDDKLSTRQGAIMTAQAACEFHLLLGRETAGTWSFHVRDADPAKVLDDASGGDAHASVCFDHCASRGEREKLGKQIKAQAQIRHKRAA